MTSPKHHADQSDGHSWRVWAITAGALAGVVLVMVAVALSPVFHAKTISVTGASALSRRAVLEAAAIDADTNLLTLSPGATEQRLEAVPWISAATVRRSLPSTLAIEVTERMPVLEVRDGHSYVVIASDATTLETTSKDPRLPELTGRVTPAAVGQANEALKGVAAMAAAWDQTVLDEDPQVSIASDGAVTGELLKHAVRHRGVAVVFGQPTDPQAKADALAGVLAWADDNHEKLVSIDLSVPQAPAAEVARKGQDTQSVDPTKPDRTKHDRHQQHDRPTGGTADVSPSPSP